jgi:Domain of unknown function (DUF4388)
MALSRPTGRWTVTRGADVNSASLRHLLNDLGTSGRTGALHVDGTPGGVLYLVAGHLTHAESPACPGVGERLVASGRLSAATWQAAYAEGSARHRVGRVLVRDGHIGQHELAARVIATICDTTHALLQGGDAPVRFVPDERHWLGVIAQVEMGALIHATARRLRTVPPARYDRELAWAGRTAPGWPRRNDRPDHATLRTIRRGVRQAI